MKILTSSANSSSPETDGMSKSPGANQIAAEACVLGFVWLSSYFGSGPTLLYVGKYPHTQTLAPAIQGNEKILIQRFYVEQKA